jgi:hypothetical protein
LPGGPGFFPCAPVGLSAEDFSLSERETPGGVARIVRGRPPAHRQHTGHMPARLLQDARPVVVRDKQAALHGNRSAMAPSQTDPTRNARAWCQTNPRLRQCRVASAPTPADDSHRKCSTADGECPTNPSAKAGQITSADDPTRTVHNRRAGTPNEPGLERASSQGSPAAPAPHVRSERDGTNRFVGE